MPDAMGAHKRRNQRLLEEWRGVAPGVPVRVTYNDGRRRDTRTRSEAYTLGDGTAVVLVDGGEWPFALERVRRLEPIPYALTEKALAELGGAA